MYRACGINQLYWWCLICLKILQVNLQICLCCNRLCARTIRLVRHCCCLTPLGVDFCQWHTHTHTHTLTHTRTHTHIHKQANTKRHEWLNSHLCWWSTETQRTQTQHNDNRELRSHFLLDRSRFSLKHTPLWTLPHPPSLSLSLSLSLGKSLVPFLSSLRDTRQAWV